MTSCDLIHTLFSPSGSSRIGLNFDRSRRDDLIFGSAGSPAGYHQRRWTEGEIEYYDDIWGNIWRRMKDGCSKGEICNPVLDDWEKLNSLVPPDFDRGLVADSYRQDFSTHLENFKIAMMSGWIFADARYLRKMENYLLDLALYPEQLKILHSRIATMYEIQIQAAGDAGADAIFFAEDLGTQQDILFSPAMWNEYFAELYAHLFDLAHQRNLRVFMHSCGKNVKLVEPLLRAGVDCFQFDQPCQYDYDYLSAMLRKYHAALWAPVDIQLVLPTGDKKLIQAEARRMCESFRGRLIAKNYPDLAGIGVPTDWDDWAYEVFCAFA